MSASLFVYLFVSLFVMAFLAYVRERLTHASLKLTQGANAVKACMLLAKAI